MRPVVLAADPALRCVHDHDVSEAVTRHVAKRREAGRLWGGWASAKTWAGGMGVDRRVVVSAAGWAGGWAVRWVRGWQ